MPTLLAAELAAEATTWIVLTMERWNYEIEDGLQRPLSWGQIFFYNLLMGPLSFNY